MEINCDTCETKKQADKHEKALYGDPVDIAGNPGVFGYIRESQAAIHALQLSMASMNKAMWIIAAALLLFLFGVQPKEIIERLLRI